MERQSVLPGIPLPSKKKYADSHRNVVKNRISLDDQPIHGWYNFVVGYPPHLVREYLGKFKGKPGKSVILDPFCGAGTTLVEAKRQGYASYGTDGNPMAVLATRVKTNWSVDTKDIHKILGQVCTKTAKHMKEINFDDLPDIPEIESAGLSYKYNGCNINLPAEQLKRIPYGFISKKPLIKFLLLKNNVEKLKEGKTKDFLLLALASILPGGVGNVRFGPEIGKGSPKEDVAILDLYRAVTNKMVSDLKNSDLSNACIPSNAYLGDARLLESIPKNSIDIVITSPPYPNEKEYTRNSRLELVLLDFVRDQESLRRVKYSLLRSNTRTAFKADNDDEAVTHIASIQKLAKQIEDKRIALGKDSGFEKLYHRVFKLYFGGMYIHLKALYPKLRRGAKCAYVVGDQMSYFKIPVRTADLLSEIASDLGYKILGKDLWRTRRSTAHDVNLEENVLLIGKG